MNWKEQFFSDPIKATLTSGCILFVSTAILLTLLKPRIVTKLNDELKSVIVLHKLLLVSVVIALTGMVCLFLVLNRDVKEELKDLRESEFGFNPTKTESITY